MISSNIQQLLHNERMHSSSNEINFILSHIDTMACFTTLSEPYHGLFAITDMDFNPIYTLETNAYINSCGISDNGEFAIF